MNRTLVILAVLALAISAARLAFLHDLPEWDQSTYFLIGDALNHGKHLYADVWDMKPPGIFAAYAIGNTLTRSSFEWTGYLLCVTCAIATTIAIYFCFARQNNSAGLFAASCFALMSLHPALAGPIPNTESFINLFLAIGLAIWLNQRSAMIVGLCFAIATMFKQVALAPILAIAIAALFDRERARRSTFIMLAMIPLCWLLLSGYFAITHRAEIFWKTNFVYPLFYASQGGSSQWGAIVNLAPLLFLAMFALSAKPASGRNALLALLAGACIAIVLPGRLFGHYLQLGLIPLSLLAGIGISAAIKRFGVIIFIALAGLLATQIDWYFDSPRERATRHSPASFVLNVDDVGLELRRLLQPNETMFAWCDEAQLYVLAKKRPIAAGLWKDHMIAGPVATMLTARTIDDLNAHPPDLVVVWSPFPGPADHPIYRWIIERYDEIPGNPGRLPLALYARRGSALHARTIAAHDQ